MNKEKKTIAVIIGTVILIAAIAVTVYILINQKNTDNTGTQNDTQTTQPVTQQSTAVQSTTAAQTTQAATAVPTTQAATAAQTTAHAQTAAQQAVQATVQPTEVSEPESTTEEQAYLFQNINDLVTAKEVTNLRAEFFDDAEVVATLSNGTYLTRTGYNENGWSRLLYGSLVVYAKTNLLLKEGETAAAVESWLDEYNMTYQEVNEQVTAKEETNLRSVPSTSEDKTIVTTIKHGEYVTRIGIGDKGWSKILYNGQTLYAVTSYLTK